MTGGCAMPPPGGEQTVTFRGSVTDLATDLKALLRVDQQQELGRILGYRAAPVPLELYCPMAGCHARHLDEGGWSTHPHHTHSCQTCGHTWRPAVVDTVGVQFLPGFKSTSAEGG